ncbi:hypothetical protein QN344_07805, partial [Mucilaginibacter sp. 5B2]|nr:hypothetical protein [Mucilaginibacter sp. 5B2]
MGSNLQIVNNSQPVSENQIIKTALTDTLVRVAIPYEIDGIVSAAIDKAIFYLGLKTTLEDRDMIKATVYDDVKRHFLNLTIAEVGIAIESGSKGLYGKVVGLAPKDVFEWLTAYSISEARKMQVAELAKQNEAYPEPTEEQKRLIRWNNMLNAWAAYKKDGSFNDHGNAVYNTLVNNGRINYSDEQMGDFRRMSKADLIKQYNPLQHIGNFVKANECKSIIAEITNGGDDNTRVIVAAKKLVLNHFFANMVEMDMEITD